MSYKYNLEASSLEVAYRLLGCHLKRTINGQTVEVKIVETEAYDQTDAASHSYRGRTPRTDVMFGPAGHAYIYFTYGMHYCFNVVTGPVGNGAAVLIRAVEPVSGLKIIQTNRPGIKDKVNLTNGPAKLCQALSIDKRLNGHDLSTSPLELIFNLPLDKASVQQTTRIGITRDADRPWRFYIKGNPFVSRV